jgi:hypothetical protein
MMIASGHCPVSMKALVIPEQVIVEVVNVRKVLRAIDARWYGRGCQPMGTIDTMWHGRG